MLTICVVDLNINLKTIKGKFLPEVSWLKPIGAAAALYVMIFVALLSAPFLDLSTASAYYFNQKTDRLAIQSNFDKTVQSIASLPAANRAVPSVGMYDPSGTAVSGASFIRHSFVDWRDYNAFASSIYISEQAGDTPLITLEPRGDIDGQKLLDDIANGVYDQNLAAISTVVSASNQDVYIRFAHEMELADVYPWGNQPPEAYVAAYRHVVDYVRSHGGKHAKWVWAPGGNYGAGDYYPGDDYVDVIGVTVLYDPYWYGDYVPSFAEVIDSRLQLSVFDKPMWIVELGSGRLYSNAQAAFITDAMENYKYYGFSVAVYLNNYDTNIHGPDYRLTDPAIFSRQFMSKAMYERDHKHTETKLKNNTASTSKSNKKSLDILFKNKQ
jgi:endoglucanase